MQRQSVDSSNLASVGYDFDSMILEVEFKINGYIYEYYNVPESLFLALLKADSLGRFFNRKIRNYYAYKKVN